MADRLKEKVSLITGAGSGIGRAIALLFASEGSAVVVNDRRRECADETVDAIRVKGENATAQKGDVSLSGEAEAIILATIASHGRVDILVNVAGGSVGVNLPADKTENDDWDKVITNNVKSTFLMSKNILPYMIKNGGGVIINMGSIFGLSGAPGMAAYSTAKAAVINLSRQMAIDYASYNIRINCLCPGPIRTPPLEHRFSEDEFERMKRATLVGRMGRPEDVAYGALYLASDESSFVTGTALVIDGGYDPRLDQVDRPL